MSQLDAQITVLEAATETLAVAEFALSLLGLEGEAAELVAVNVTLTQSLTELKRRRGNAGDVLEQAAIERLWRNVMQRVRGEEQAA